MTDGGYVICNAHFVMCVVWALLLSPPVSMSMSAPVGGIASLSARVWQSSFPADEPICCKRAGLGWAAGADPRTWEWFPASSTGCHPPHTRCTLKKKKSRDRGTALVKDSVLGCSEKKVTRRVGSLGRQPPTVTGDGRWYKATKGIKFCRRSNRLEYFFLA